MSQRRYIVVGAGAVGGLVGARLADGGNEVCLVARGDHYEEIARRGLRVVTNAGARRSVAEVVSSVNAIEFGPNDVVLVAVKSHQSEGVFDELAMAAPASTPVVALQNGVSNETALLARFETVIGALVQVAAGHHRPGEVIGYGVGELGYIDLGAVPHGDEAAGALARELSDDLRNAGFRSDMVGDILAWKRRKLLANLINALDALCGPSAWGSGLGALVVAEGEAVFRCAGLAVVSEAEMRGRRAPEIATQVPAGTPPIASSTTQGVGRGARGIETFHLNGMILSLGRQHGVATPANALVQSELISLIRSEGPLGAQDPDELLARLLR